MGVKSLISLSAMMLSKQVPTARGLRKYDGLQNVNGPLTFDTSLIERLEDFFRSPSNVTWTDVYAIVLNLNVNNGDGSNGNSVDVKKITFWQAVCTVDSRFQRERRKGDSWEYIPDIFTARRALQFAREGKKRTDL